MDEDETYLYYDANSPGFSYFVIMAGEVEAVSEALGFIDPGIEGIFDAVIGE